MANRCVVLPVTRETLISLGVYQKWFQPTSTARMNQGSCVSHLSGPGIKYCMTVFIQCCCHLGVLRPTVSQSMCQEWVNGKQLHIISRCDAIHSNILVHLYVYTFVCATTLIANLSNAKLWHRLLYYWYISVHVGSKYRQITACFCPCWSEYKGVSACKTCLPTTLPRRGRASLWNFVHHHSSWKIWSLLYTFLACESPISENPTHTFHSLPLPPTHHFCSESNLYHFV